MLNLTRLGMSFVFLVTHTYQKYIYQGYHLFCLSSHDENHRINASNQEDMLMEKVSYTIGPDIGISW